MLCARRSRRESPDQTPTTSGVVAGDLRIAHVGTPCPPACPTNCAAWSAADRPAFVGGVSAFAVGFGVVLLVAGLPWAAAALALVVGLGLALAVAAALFRMLTR
ncbi:MAG: hypothetical protein HOY78_07315 [Saccharothrix sp.]|nr:hypothetical protein [Saccharothrix sp.]